MTTIWELTMNLKTWTSSTTVDSKRKKMIASGDPKRVAHDVHYASGYFRAAFAAANDGTLVYVSGAIVPTSRVNWFDRSGKVLSENVTALGALWVL